MSETSTPPPQRLLLVCNANRARSPLAAAMLQQEAAARRISPVELAVASAGVRATDGASAVSSVQAIAAKRGLDLTRHRAELVRPTLIAASDIVLTMTEDQRSTVGRLVDGGFRKTFTLVEFVRLTSDSKAVGSPLSVIAGQAHLARPRVIGSSEPEDIVDPIGGSTRLLHQITGDLARLTGQVAEVLFGGDR